MNDVDKLYDLLQTEVSNQEMYNKYMLTVQHPEIRQMFLHLRDGKTQQVIQIQKEIKNMIAAGQHS